MPPPPSPSRTHPPSSPLPKRTILDGIIGLPTVLPNGQTVTLAIPTPTDPLTVPYITTLPSDDDPLESYTIELFPLTTTIPISVFPPGVSTASNGLLDEVGYYPQFVSLGDGSLLGRVAIDQVRGMMGLLVLRSVMCMSFGWGWFRCGTSWTRRVRRERKQARLRRGGIAIHSGKSTPGFCERIPSGPPSSATRLRHLLLPSSLLDTWPRTPLTPSSFRSLTGLGPESGTKGSLRDRTMGLLLLSQVLGFVEGVVVVVQIARGFGDVAADVEGCVRSSTLTSLLRLISLTLLLSVSLFLRTHVLLERPVWLGVVNAVLTAAWAGSGVWGIMGGRERARKGLLGLCEYRWAKGESISMGLMTIFAVIMAICLVRLNRQLASLPKALGRTSLHYSVHASTIFRQWTFQRPDAIPEKRSRSSSIAPSVASAAAESFGEKGISGRNTIGGLGPSLPTVDRRGSGQSLLLAPPGDERGRNGSFASWPGSDLLDEGLGPPPSTPGTPYGMTASPRGAKRVSNASTMQEDPSAEYSPVDPGSATRWQAPSIWNKSRTRSNGGNTERGLDGPNDRETIGSVSSTGTEAVGAAPQGTPDYLGIADEMPERKAFRVMVQAQAIIMTAIAIVMLIGVLLVDTMRSDAPSLGFTDWADVTWTVVSILAVQSFSRYTWSDCKGEVRPHSHTPELVTPRKKATRPPISTWTTGFSAKAIPPVRDGWSPYPEDVSPVHSSRAVGPDKFSVQQDLEGRDTITALPRSLLARRRSEPRTRGISLYEAEQVLDIEQGRQPSFISPRRRGSVRWSDNGSGMASVPSPRRPSRSTQAAVTTTETNPFEDPKTGRGKNWPDSGTQELSKQDLADILFSAGVEEGPEWVKKGSSHASSAYTFPETDSRHSMQ